MEQEKRINEKTSIRRRQYEARQGEALLVDQVLDKLEICYKGIIFSANKINQLNNSTEKIRKLDLGNEFEENPY